MSRLPLRTIGDAPDAAKPPLAAAQRLTKPGMWAALQITSRSLFVGHRFPNECCRMFNSEERFRLSPNDALRYFFRSLAGLASNPTQRVRTRWIKS
jgi:hypothetical protein